MKTREPVNPFYVALVVLGIAFFLSATVYGMLAIREVRLGPVPETGLLGWMDRNGTWLLAEELVLLAVAVAAAIGLDSRREARAVRQKSARDGARPHPEIGVGD